MAVTAYLELEQYLSASVAFYSMRYDLFGDVERISASDWRHACRTGDPDKLLVLSQRKLAMLRSYFELQRILHRESFERFTRKWIYLVECNLDNLRGFDTEDDAFDAGCEIGEFPPGVVIAFVQ